MFKGLNGHHSKNVYQISTEKYFDRALFKKAVTGNVVRKVFLLYT